MKTLSSTNVMSENMITLVLRSIIDKALRIMYSGNFPFQSKFSVTIQLEKSVSKRQKDYRRRSPSVGSYR
jgi:hypothetical protein